MTEERKVLVYQGDNGLVVEIPVESVEVDEDEDMIYFSYDIIEEGTAVPSHEELGPMLGKYLLDLINKYATEVIATQPE